MVGLNLYCDDFYRGLASIFLLTNWIKGDNLKYPKIARLKFNNINKFFQEVINLPRDGLITVEMSGSAISKIEIRPRSHEELDQAYEIIGISDENEEMLVGGEKGRLVDIWV